jgi:class 3 adenylate cyclase
MEFNCPNCGAITPATGKFCKECAYDLRKPKEAPSTEPTPKALSIDEKIAKIQRYLPKGLTEKILAQRERIEGERKQVTVMFCDMEGFTAFTEKLGPEEAYGIMDKIYELLIHKVHDYEGTVNEMTGDGVMALFGAPIALEDAPQRAIRSAMAIHREMGIFSDKIRQEREGIPPLKMRIGIHTGPVVVGTLGNDLRVEFKAVGDTVNLASRVEGLAVPGSTYVAEETFRLAEGLFRFEALGQKEVKGKEEPVNVYRVIAPSTRRTRFDVSAERGLTPFVGRERELELVIDGFQRAKTGRGQAFSIMAEAGVGKSRILYEFRKAVTNEDVTFLEGRCLSYSRGVAYHPVIEVLKANFNIRDSDGDSEIREKVKGGLTILGADEASTLPYLLELLSVKESGVDKIPMSPEAKKDRIMEAVKQIRGCIEICFREHTGGKGLKPIHLPARVCAHLGRQVVPQPTELEPALQPGKPCHGGPHAGHRRDRQGPRGVDLGEDRRGPFFHRGVYKVPPESKDYRKEGQQILFSKRYRRPYHTFCYPRYDNGQSGLPSGGCEGCSSDWLSRRPGVQP